jgi:anaerobic magnesium-protoporphyrin IX monomethyl ester cyclase
MIATDVKNLKQYTQVPIAMGGPGYTDYEVLLKAGVDFVCEGEGELTIIDLIKNIQSNKSDWSIVDGISYVQNGEIIVNKRREQVKNLDNLDFPLRDNFIPPTVYHDYHLPGFRAPYIGMLTNRGCPRRCSFCDSPNIWDQTVRHRSVDNVMEEIDYAVDKWKIRYIDFVDDIFGINHRWTEEFANKLIERNYDLKFKILMNPSSFGKRQDKIVRLLTKAGLDTVGIGVQTADDQMLTKIRRKGEGKEQLKDLVKSCRKNGVLSFANFILGMPGEEIHTAAKKIKDLLDEVRPLVMDCYPYVLLRGTEIDIDVKEGRSELMYDYETRFGAAQSVVRHFYTSPINLFNIFKWFLLHNPSGIRYRFSKVSHVLQLMGVINSHKKSKALPIH